MDRKAALRVRMPDGSWVMVPALIVGNAKGGDNIQGGYYIPSVVDGVLSWVPSLPDMPSIENADIRGPKGEDGTTLTGFTQSQADGGYNYIMFSNGMRVPIRNGTKGSTPVKGTDYWTADDRQRMVNDVLAALPAAEGVSF